MTIDKDFLNQLYTPTGTDELLDVMRDAPTPYRPIITQSNAEDGFIIRYFVKQVSDKKNIVEVNDEEYNRLRDNPRFITTQIRWKIIGPTETVLTSAGIKNLGVRDYNLLEVSKTDLTFGGLHRYIRNYVEFWLAETL